MSPADALLEPFRRAFLRRLDPPTGDAPVGTMSSNAPLELFAAAGLVPYRLFPAPRRATPAADEFMEPVFDGAIRSLFDRLLNGDFNALRLIVVPRASEGYLQLFYFLQEADRLRAGRGLPALHLFDLLKTPHWSTRRYVRDELAALRTALEAITGEPLTDDALRQACVAMNHQRRLLAQVNALRREAASRLSGTDMLQIIAAAGVMPAGEHCAALQRLLDGAAALPVRAGVRVMVKGSPIDDLAFYELVESCGAVIVADDHANGERAFEGLVDEQLPPLDALARKYHRDSPSLRSLPQAREDARFIEIAIAAQVQAVIFFHEENDDTLGWDHPAQRRPLDVRGIPSILLRQQPYQRPADEAQRARIAPWLAAVAEGLARAGASA